ncbi:MAG TPA: STAS domain-containing protein [Terriglobales bacterium]|nr:STAS domain-containing protein [Terriglobales bacterium]
MKINFRAVDGVTILDMDGRITLGDDIAVFKSAIGGLVAQGYKMVLLNLREVPYIDSSGIGELVAAFTGLRKSGGELKLLNLTKKVRTLLEITRLYSVFDVREDETSAILSFSAKPLLGDPSVAGRRGYGM